MTDRDDLKPLTSPMELHLAIAEAAARFPGDPEAAGAWLLANYALDPVMAQSLRLEGERKLHGLN